MINISDKTKKYLDMMENKFNIENFYEFVKDLLNLENEDLINGKFENATSEQYKHYIDKSQLYAKYQDNKREMIGVLIVKLKDNKTPANARTLQRNYIAHLLEYYNLDASITAIYSDTEDTWRLSFIKKELQIEVGKRGTKIGEKISPAKRYSYLFGKDEPNHTAKEQLLELLENNTEKFSIEKIEERFSVEKVTKDFFERYKENYLKLKEMLEKNEEFVSEAKRCDFTSEEFTKKLLGQIVFIYFLQKKGWLGVKLVPSILSMNEYKEIYDRQDILGKKILDKYYINYNGIKKIKSQLLEKYKENEDEINKLSSAFIKTKYDKMWGTGEKKFIRTIFTNCVDRNKNFFDDYLEPFFYDGLNNKRANQYFGLFNCKIPFLNGGLFEPLDNYDWKIAKFNIRNDVFSNNEETGILDFFDRYNFTMNEEEPLEKDVAVDPEMLGKIFENLLDVKDRKSKGAFYTPREIVHYMCQESIANYLVNKVGTDYDETIEFIKYGEMIRDIDLKKVAINDCIIGKTILRNIRNIDKALKNIKIADPAVGSGAFPLGMLNEIVKLRDIVTSYLLIYNKFGLFGKRYSEEIITNKRNIYNIKWNTIRNCIYAVDIENSAVDITKLRLWLSLVVDQVDIPITGPEPLPNLDCKIMQGNSLIDEYEGIKLIDDKFIEELKDRSNIKFNDSNGSIRDLKGHKQYISQNQIQIGDGQKKSVIDELINEKSEYFGTNDSSRKEEIKNKIKELRNELLNLNFIGSNKEKELFKIDNSHNKPYFAWKLEFIEVFIENNGFDIIIGNPPYVGEKGNKNVFEPINESSLGKRFHIGRMDLFYYFFHKSIDIAKKDAIITFITTNYYVTADGGNLLRKDFFDRTQIIKLINFNEVSIFETAKGQHNMITFLKKDSKDNDTLVYNARKNELSDKENINKILNLDNKEYTKIPKSKLYDGEQYYIRMLVTNSTTINIQNSIIDKIKKGIPLIEICNVNQGARTGADKVTDKHIKKYGRVYNKGDGIFVLTVEEVKKNNLINCNILKPWFKNSDIDKYFCENENKYFVIYSSEDEILKEENKPVLKYLEKYKAILEDRNSEYEWYKMDRPRKKEIFMSEKIVSPQRSYRNNFAWNNNEWFASADVYFITKKENIDLKYILGLLNSKLYYYWLYFQGKRKGEMLELYQTPLSEIPILIANEVIQNDIIGLVTEIINYKKINKEYDITEKQNKLDNIIYNLFGITNEEIELIEKVYNKRRC